MTIAEILTPGEFALFKPTLQHFFHPDYATEEEEGHSFRHRPSPGDAPMEIILRDGSTTLNNGTGGRLYKQGDCYALYVKLYESGLTAHNDEFDQRP